jgi:TetR/AcrR family transcriptional repressor of mexJK operon
MTANARGRPIDPTKDRDILAAGRKLLFEQGPQAVTMEAVARVAGIAKPTLYRRYANRDELLAAIALNESESMAGRFDIQPGSADDLKQALLDFGNDLTRFLLSREHIRFIQTLGASTGMSQASRESIYRNGPLATRDRVAAWLASAHRQRLLECPEPESSAEQLIGMLMGLNLVRSLYRVQSPREVSDVDPRAERIVRDFLRLHAARE